MSADEVYYILSNLAVHKAAGADNLLGILLRAAAPGITHSLVHLFNILLPRGKLPSHWETRQTKGHLQEEGLTILPRKVLLYLAATHPTIQSTGENCQYLPY